MDLYYALQTPEPFLPPLVHQFVEPDFSKTENEIELSDEQYEFELLKEQWMDTHRMTDEEFEADLDLQMFLKIKAINKAKDDTKIREENEQKQKEEEERLAALAEEKHQKHLKYLQKVAEHEKRKAEKEE